MVKNKLVLLLNEIIRFNEPSNFLAQNLNDSPLCFTRAVFNV